MLFKIQRMEELCIPVQTLGVQLFTTVSMVTDRLVLERGCVRRTVVGVGLPLSVNVRMRTHIVCSFCHALHVNLTYLVSICRACS